MNNKLSRKARTTRVIMSLITLIGFVLSACKPEEIVTTNTSLETKIQQTINEMCDPSPCRAIGQ